MEGSVHPQQLQDFVEHATAREALLTVAEVAALRLYTGPVRAPVAVSIEAPITVTQPAADHSSTARSPES